MRNYKRKTTRGTISLDVLKRAARLVLEEKIPLRRVAQDYSICRMTLIRFVARYKQNPNISTSGYSSPRQVFTVEIESRLTEYLLELGQIFHGIDGKDVQRLAYDYAIKLKLKIPETWNGNKIAGKDWLDAFLKRNIRLSLRKHDVNSRSKATSFNKMNIDNFFEKLGAVMDRHTLAASSIWNADETEISTCRKSSKIVETKGKQDGPRDGTEETEKAVALVIAISASGSSIPSMFIFPKEEYPEHIIRNGPPDAIGMGNSSGCVTHVEYFGFMQHFIKHVKPSKEFPVLLMLENNPSHISINTLDLAKENGVVLLSFPPHCSYKLQPLDVAVYKPFKRYLSSAQDAWIRNNPGKNMTIYDIPSIVRTALPLALSPTKIIKGFEATGIFPINQSVFQDCDYAPNLVIDRPAVKNEKSVTKETGIKMANVPLNRSDSDYFTLTRLENLAQPSTSKQLQSSQSSTACEEFSTELITPFFEADSCTLNRKSGIEAIHTDSVGVEASNKEKGKRVGNKNKKIVKKKFLRDSEFESSSSEEDYFCIICCEAFFQSNPGNNWIQCNKCKEWAEKQWRKTDYYENIHSYSDSR